MHTGAVAIVPRRRRMKLNVVLELKLGGAAQRLAQNLGFVPQLRFVVHMLIVASAAAAKVRTTWRSPVGRRRQYLVEVGASEAGAALDHRDLDLLAWQHKRHKDGLAATLFVGRHARQTVATVNQFFDLYLQRRDLNPRTTTHRTADQRGFSRMISCLLERARLQLCRGDRKNSRA